jgi:hypothetical protein
MEPLARMIPRDMSGQGICACGQRFLVRRQIRRRGVARQWTSMWFDSVDSHVVQNSCCWLSEC